LRCGAVRCIHLSKELFPGKIISYDDKSNSEFYENITEIIKVAREGRNTDIFMGGHSVSSKTDFKLRII
jgi:hypothetical protein